MDNLDDPYMLSYASLITILSFNLFFSSALINDYKTYFIRRQRASVSAIVNELSSKSKNYYQTSDTRFWKLHKQLKDVVDKKEYYVSRQTRKKWKQNFVPNGIMHSSVRVSIAL